MFVAPLAGAWIEIFEISSISDIFTVAPLAGAWIEMKFTTATLQPMLRRSPRGSVD